MVSSGGARIGGLTAGGRDDAGAAPDAPTIVLPGLVGLLALALVVGGIVVAATTGPEREPRGR